MEARQGQEVASLSCHEAPLKKKLEERQGSLRCPARRLIMGIRPKKQKAMGNLSHSFLFFYTRFADGIFGGSVQPFFVLYSLIQSIKFDETVTVISEKTILLTGI